MPPVSNVVRGRYAPSPTGRLHLGNARTALVAWLSARSAGGIFVWRLEDLDRQRVVPGMAEAAVDDLRWLGLDWDEGPEAGGSFGPYRQSERMHIYEDALRALLRSERVFPCRHSRRDLQVLASAPHDGGTSPYPAALRPADLQAGWYDRVCVEKDAAIRFMVHDRPVRFLDLVSGAHEEVVSDTVGDFVLRRRDDVYAYQLAVVVDDLAMEITEVVRGRDLLDSTARQIQLIEALGGSPPVHAHVPLVLGPDGDKLSKRHASLTVESLRAAGVRPEQLVGYFAYSLGLTPAPEAVSAHEAISIFNWENVSKRDWMLPEDVIDQVKVLG